MRLKDWMERERHTDATFVAELNKALAAAKHKPLTWRAVAPWRTGLSVPRPAVIEAISAVTKGAVKYADHVAQRAERAERDEQRKQFA